MTPERLRDGLREIREALAESENDCDISFSAEEWRDRCIEAMAEVDRLEGEGDDLIRASEWLPHDGDPLTLEHLQGIKLRWATGPEQYQQDADAMICEITRLGSEVDRLEAALSAMISGCKS